MQKVLKHEIAKGYLEELRSDAIIWVQSFYVGNRTGIGFGDIKQKLENDINEKSHFREWLFSQVFKVE